MDGFKKRYKMYKDYLLEKENNDNTKYYDLFQNKTSNNNNNNLDYLQIKKSNKNINNNNNNHNNQQKKNINDNKGYLYGNKKSNTLLLGKNINENKKLKSPEIRKKGHQLPSSNSDSFQRKKFRKKSTNLILQLPTIKKENIPNLNLKTEKNRKSLLPLNHLYEKNLLSKKGKISPKKTTTINIYNNKINNINNIILNDKKIKKSEENKSSNKEEESDTIKSSKYIENKDLNLLEKDENEENDKGVENKDKKENKNFSEDLINKNYSETQISNEITGKYELSNNGDTNDIKNSTKKMLIRRLSVNYHNEFLNKIPLIRHKSEDNFDEMEKKIRKKILKSHALIVDMNFRQNLTKTKKDITIKLFEELSKKVSIDIEDTQKQYNNKEMILFDQKYMVVEKNEYIKKVHKKIKKLIKKTNNFIYITKNKSIKIYEKNIANYSKITIHDNNYLFFKYIYNNYFDYITYTILNNKDFNKTEKNNNLQTIYNVSNSSSSYSSSTLRPKGNYIHSIFYQYFLMEKDKIQKYLFNEQNLDKTVAQINNFVMQAKAKINDLKTGNKRNNIIFNNNIKEGLKIINETVNNGPNLNNKNTFILNLKTDYSESDRYDSKSGTDTQRTFPGNMKFNNIQNNNTQLNNNINNTVTNEEQNSLFSKSKNLLLRKSTFSNEVFKSNISNKINNNNNLNTDSKQDIENKYNLAIIKKEKIEKKYNQNITKNKDYFFKRKKNINIKNTKRQLIVTPKKEFDFLRGNYMFKNMLDYRTDEIKTSIKQNIKSPVEMLFYQIKEHDFDEFCELFERKQIDLNARNNDKDSFLIYAVKCKGMNFVQYLLKRGIDVNLENKYGNTALHYAFSDQNFELADILLRNGADEFKVNIFGKTPWQCLGDKKV